MLLLCYYYVIIMFLYRLYPKIIMSVSKPHRILAVPSPSPHRPLTVPVMYLFVYCSGWEPLFTSSIPSVQRSKSLEYYSAPSPRQKNPHPPCACRFYSVLLPP